MKILLSLVPDCHNTSNPYKATMDLGLGYLASCLRKNNFQDVDIYTRQHAGMDSFFQKLDSFKPDVIGFKVFSIDVNSLNRLLDKIKSIPRYKHIVIAVGGPSPSGNKEKCFSVYPLCDYAFYAESEVGFPLLCKHILMGDPSPDKIPNLIYKDSGGKINVNPPQLVNNLDEIPFPAWDLIKPELFPNTPSQIFSKRAPFACVITSRGCPFLCKFCGSFLLSGRIVRARSAENIFREIQYLYQRHGIKEIQFYDTNIFHHKENFKNFCRLVIESKMDIVWNALGVQLHTIDEELLQLIKKSGCYQLSVGIESGSERILKYINKGISKAQIVEKINLIAKHKIDILAYFMIGFPSETREEMMETFQFSQSLPIDYAAIAIFSCLPGTPFYHEMLESKKIEEIDENTLNFIDARNNASEVTDKELYRLHKRFNFYFHIRPKQLWYFLKNINNIDKAKYLFYAVYRVLFKHRQ